jgi:hypothetical protein
LHSAHILSSSPPSLASPNISRASTVYASPSSSYPGPAESSSARFVRAARHILPGSHHWRSHPNHPHHAGPPHLRRAVS